MRRASDMKVLSSGTRVTHALRLFAASMMPAVAGERRRSAQLGGKRIACRVRAVISCNARRMAGSRSMVQRRVSSMPRNTAARNAYFGECVSCARITEERHHSSLALSSPGSYRGSSLLRHSARSVIRLRCHSCSSQTIVVSNPVRSRQALFRPVPEERSDVSMERQRQVIGWGRMEDPVRAHAGRSVPAID